MMSSGGLVCRQWAHFQGNIVAIDEGVLLNNETIYIIK
jgi:hypothetical protein